MENFDFTQVAVGGVALVWLIPRLVEFAKTLGLTGKKNIVIVVFAVGIVFAGVAATIAEGLMPAIVLPWLRVAVFALAGGIASCGAIGEYELGKARNK